MSTVKPSSQPIILFTHEHISYELIQPLGLGPQGEALVLARKRTSRGIGELVLVKCLGKPGPGEAPSASSRHTRARLEEEVRLATYLDHPAIARVHGLHEAQGTLYAVVEHVPGVHLDDLLMLAQQRERYFSETFALYLGAGLASALHHAHTRRDEQGRPLGIVHRNLSTTSVGLTWSGEVRVADFGLAFSRLTGRQPTTARRPRLPVFFTAPEVLWGSAAEARSDLFSLGMVLLEFTTGRNLFDPPDKTPEQLSASLPAAEQARVSQVIRTLRRAGLDGSEEQAFWGAASFTPGDVARLTSRLAGPLKPILHRLLRRAPAERFQTAEELEKALRAGLREAGAYGAREALAEIDRALSDAGAALVEDELCARQRFPMQAGPEQSTR
ncbi:MAG TPA: protein kinase [Myxococcaceae bacterium]|jgi:serine/threonine-protein kinase